MPRSSVARVGDSHFVLIGQPPDAQAVRVELGATSGANVAIRSGVAEGDPVVTRPTESEVRALAAETTDKGDHSDSTTTEPNNVVG